IIHEKNLNKNLNKIKKCINQNISFKKSLLLQREGMPIIKLINGRINIKATWELIPRHFNNIWINEFNKMEIFRLQSDEEEQKYFVKFLTNLKRPFNCNIITLGVGHSIWAERNLSKIYPECHFFGVDPASEINSDLIHKKNWVENLLKLQLGEKH
ncbi:Methyltransf_21 domain-containing protein, partial [Meloidogyne graminicola]